MNKQIPTVVLLSTLLLSSCADDSDTDEVKMLSQEDETKIISEELACKGIIDFIGKFQNKSIDGEPEDEPFYALVDWKTSTSLDEFRTQCQLTLYYFLLKEQYPELAAKIQQLRCLQITKYQYRWFRFPIDEKLGESLLYLYKNYLRADHE